jgi:hypothetical protein
MNVSMSLSADSNLGLSYWLCHCFFESLVIVNGMPYFLNFTLLVFGCYCIPKYFSDLFWEGVKLLIDHLIILSVTFKTHSAGSNIIYLRLIISTSESKTILNCHLSPEIVVMRFFLLYDWNRHYFLTFVSTGNY